MHQETFAVQNNGMITYQLAQKACVSIYNEFGAAKWFQSTMGPHTSPPSDFLNLTTDIS